MRYRKRLESDHRPHVVWSEDHSHSSAYESTSLKKVMGCRRHDGLWLSNSQILYYSAKFVQLVRTRQLLAPPDPGTKMSCQWQALG